MTNGKPEVLTFGCRLNASESETLQKNAEQAGLKDTVIINTCAVTAEAERQAGQAIRKLKRENPNVKILVTGCSSQIDPKKYEAMPEVDGIIDNGHKLLPGSLSPVLHKSHAPQNFKVTESPTGKMQRAFIQVQNGCNHRCTYCVIPFGRGESRSISFETVTRQARAYVEAGFQEIVLTGVDITSYGRDLPGEPTLGYLVRHVLTRLPELKRLRLSSIDPAAIDADLWNEIENEPRLMPHLHLSLQSGDDIILKRMKRRHLRHDIVKLVERARKSRPDMVFGADIIAGFPTETEEMFHNTVQLVKDAGLTWLHIFQYSARKGTPAARMPQLHGNIRKTRADTLRGLGEKAELAHYEALIGQKVKVLVENNGTGCTPQFAKVTLKDSQPIGQIVDVHCVKMENNRVVAERIS